MGAKNRVYEKYYVRSTASPAQIFAQGPRFLPGVKHNGVVGVRQITKEEYERGKQNVVGQTG